MKQSTIDNLVTDWDEVYKKGQLTLWVLLAIADSPKYAQGITDFIAATTNNSFTVKEQSLYRALRRFHSLGLVESQEYSSPESGSNRKYYSLTPGGRQVLAQFTARNIRPLLSNNIVRLINNLESGEYQ